MFITKTRTVMENQDKLYDQYKEAARKAEEKGFGRMEAVWNRLEEKLDEKKERRGIAWLKYSRIAAMLVLFIAVGTYMFRDSDDVITPNAVPENNITTVDTAKIKSAGDAVRNGVQEEVVVVNGDKGSEVGYGTAGGFAVGDEAPEPVIPENVAEQVTALNKTGTSQNIQIETSGNNIYTGVVVDDTGMPVPGVNVIIKGTQLATSTDFDGKFQLPANKGDVFELSYVGFQTQTAIAGNNVPLEIALSPDNQPLAEARLDVYRSTTVAKSASAVTSVSIEAIENRGNASVLQSLQGQVAGLTIATGTEAPGKRKSDDDYDKYMYENHYVLDEKKEFKGNESIILRGVGTINGNIEPLFVIDGVPVDEAAFRTVNQQDITSINVLKDAAATSIYGNRGSNGVIVITTNRKTEVNKAELKREVKFHKKDAPLILLNGEVSKRSKMREMDSNSIESIYIVDDETATRLYGKDARNGVLIVKTINRTAAEEQALEQLIRKLDYQGKNIYKEIRYIPERIGVDQEEYEHFIENQFENPATTPLSTFSIDVDNASYTNIRRFLNNGQVVPKDAVRVEEMINFFKYQYPQPKGNDPFSINTEYSDAPWNPKHKLLKIGLQGKEIPTAKLPASNFVFLIDVSGSMNEPNKMPLLKQSMKLLVNQMRKEDRIAIVVYAGAAGLVLPSTSGAEKATIIAALENLSAGGSTAGGAGIELAYKTAQEHFLKDGNNRVILATDGDFNVGASSNSDMQTLIEEKRKSGVFLTCLGYGMGNYKDSKLETLADKGNGNYAYIDNMQEADRFLQKEFKGSMYAIAKDVKIQIEFNPKHVQSYRLIGYENRKLRDEDFTNDAIDAGELGSGHTVTALYEIIPVGVKSDFFTSTPELKYSTPQTTTGNYNDELATIKFRHKKLDEDVSKEIVQVIPNTSVPLQKATGDFKFSAAVAWFGLKLRDSKLVPNKETKAINDLAKEGLANDIEGYRSEFVRLVNMVQ